MVSDYINLHQYEKKLFNYFTCVLNIIKLAIYTHANKVIVEYILEIYVQFEITLTMIIIIDMVTPNKIIDFIPPQSSRQQDYHLVYPVAYLSGMCKIIISVALLPKINKYKLRIEESPKYRIHLTKIYLQLSILFCGVFFTI